jgi:hypothetical protein
VATLLTLILNMIGFDTTTPINCQVSPVSHVWLIDQLVNYNCKAWATGEVVSNLLYVTRFQCLIPNSLIVGFSQHRLWLRFVVDYDSHVRLRCVMITPLKQDT